LIDGQRGLGQPAALLAAEVAARKAHEVGAAAVGVTESEDIFMIGYYAEQIARAGAIGLVFTSGPPLVHPHGGMEKMLSTNPIAFGIPTGGAHPFVFDMATSAQSNARIRQAAYHGEQVPPGSGIGPDGRPTNDAATIRKGAISPLGGHKGFGLGLVVALLSGPLTGSDIGPALAGMIGDGPAAAQGHFFIAIDPAALGDPTAFEERVRTYLEQIKSSRRAPGAEPIRIPGERAFAERERCLREGIEVLTATWDIIGGLAGELGVELPAAR
jgi:L-2-hydroxycarboxylate dehydrogenase (NAD+)